MKLKIKSLKEEIYNIYSAEGLFFTGFIIFLGRAMWETTMLPLNGLVSLTCFLLSILFIGLKIVFFDTYSVSGYISVFIGFIGTILIYLNSGYLNPFFWILILIGCKDISFEKILKIYLLITVSITILALCAALLGIIENLIYETAGRGTRIAFGSVYVTDFASHIFYMTLAYCYLKADHLEIYHFIGIIIIAGVVYYFCRTRLDCISIFLIVITFGINRWLQKLQFDGKGLLKKWKNFWKWIAVGSIPFFAIISAILTIYYRIDNKVLGLINNLISDRLRQGKIGFDNYQIKLWGQKVDMVGAGGTIKPVTNYFFIDNSYIHVLLRYGMIFTITLLVIYVLCSYKKREDIYFLFVLVLVSLNCVIAHHILEVAYNPFAYVFLAYSGERKFHFLS